MSALIILLDQNFNANYVDIMVFEPSVLFPPAAVWGGGGKMTWSGKRPKLTPLPQMRLWFSAPANQPTNQP